MSDPFSQLVPRGGTVQGEVRRSAQNQTFAAWRQANIALADLYVCDKNYTVPPPLAEDGKPLTMERRKELMAGKTPMFEPPLDGDNSKAKPTCTTYTFKFDDSITSESLGESAIKNRPKVIKVYPPVKLKDKSHEEKVKEEGERKDPS